MRKQFGWVACLTLALGANPVLAGDKVLTVDDKGVEVNTDVKDSDPKVNIDLGIGKDIPLPAKQFQVKMDAGKSYTISLTTSSKEFDPFLVVQDKDGKQLATDDDSGGGLNSLLKFSPKASGTFKVFAASLGGNSGPVTLKITSAAGAKTKALKVGDTINGALAADSLQQTFDVELKADTTYQIDMKSGDVDAFLTLESPDGKRLAFNDDFGGSLDSRIEYRPTASGTYRIIATSLSKRETGNFSLTIQAK